MPAHSGYTVCLVILRQPWLSELDEQTDEQGSLILVPKGPLVATMEPVIRVELERIEALELLGMTLAHLNDAEARAETSPRVPLLMAIRDKLALGLREEL